MTVFLYVDRSKTIKRMRCVMFQAKMKPAQGPYVIGNEDLDQRTLYDECVGFEYFNSTVVDKGETRRFPTGSSRKKALQYLFVGPRPVEISTTPANSRKDQLKQYGPHLVSFLSGKTGLNHGKRKDDWSLLIMELMEKTAAKLHTDGKIRGTGVKDLLTHFNSFEDHHVWNLDDGEGEGLGVQLVIVWDSNMGDETLSVTKKPKTPVPVVSTEVTQPKTVEELEEELVEEERQAISVELIC